MKYRPIPEIVLGNIPEVEIPELQVSYNRSSGKFLSGTISSSFDVAEFIRNTIGKNEVELQEQFIVLYLSQANRVIGYYKHSKGSINATVADTRIILGTALKCACVAMIVAHNHPSGNLKPSKADEGLLSLAGLSGLIDGHLQFVSAVTAALEKKVSHNKTSIEKMALSFGITDKTEVKELTELAIVKRARGLAHTNKTTQEKFQDIVELYNSQVNLSHRTSQSILLQQYSTPAPIGYLAGVFCGLDKGATFFEPSAGNGLLTIAANPSKCTVNEIDTTRRRNLETQGFSLVMNVDATKPFRGLEKSFDAIITNPPFGNMEVEVMWDTFPIKPLEHVMALRALDCMKDSGKAAIIIGGHTKWDDKGRVQAGKNRIFFNYLYSRYNVVDVINIDGGKLYSRQGTSFDVRLILIDGRKSLPSGAAPIYNASKDKEVKIFDELYERVIDAKAGEGVPITNQSIFTLYKKYQSIKLKYPDAIVLQRDGAEYKIFGDDALELARNTSLLIAGDFLIEGRKVRSSIFRLTHFLFIKTSLLKQVIK